MTASKVWSEPGLFLTLRLFECTFPLLFVMELLLLLNVDVGYPSLTELLDAEEYEDELLVELVLKLLTAWA